VERFFNKVLFLPTGCWKWKGALNNVGYGSFWASYTRYGAHRFSYLLLHGNLTSGLEIDHLCRNKWCVNPFHLQEVTHEENLFRGTGGQRRTHCYKGHEFTVETSYKTPVSNRCKICRSEYYKERKLHNVRV
jgi:hypothetical protein